MQVAPHTWTVMGDKAATGMQKAKPNRVAIHAWTVIGDRVATRV
ncbi:MAG: hypothetical protein Q4D87_09105 [Actinomycetaceae bacterium]|nr:hypothetical protein [Actinomycetaceae bacterium]